MKLDIQTIRGFKEIGALDAGDMFVYEGDVCVKIGNATGFATQREDVSEHLSMRISDGYMIPESITGEASFLWQMVTPFTVNAIQEGEDDVDTV